MTEFLIKIFIGKSPDFSLPKNRERCGLLGSVTGIICNIMLCTLKIAVGAMFSAISIVADGLNNLSDMGSSIITLIGFRLAGKPADKDHPFGHGRMEYMSAFIVSMLIVLVGAELIISAVKALINGEASPKYTLLALIVLGFSVLTKLWMFFFNRKLSKKINSSALRATAQDSVNDVITTVVILICTILSMVIDIPFNLDAVTAIGVGLFIVFSGIVSAKDTLNEILGTPPEKDLIEELEREITAYDGFLGIHDLIVHNYGPGRQFASVHVEVPQNTNIVVCHEQIDLCEKSVSEKTGIELVIHMDPIDTDNKAVNFAKEKMKKGLEKIDARLTLHDFRMTPAAKRRTNLIFDVVVPDKFKLTRDELRAEIDRIAKEINSTYCCVVTVDSDYTGK